MVVIPIKKYPATPDEVASYWLNIGIAMTKKPLKLSLLIIIGLLIGCATSTEPNKTEPNQEKIKTYHLKILKPFDKPGQSYLIKPLLRIPRKPSSASVPEDSSSKEGVAFTIRYEVNKTNTAPHELVRVIKQPSYGDLKMRAIRRWSNKDRRIINENADSNKNYYRPSSLTVFVYQAASNKPEKTKDREYYLHEFDYTPNSKFDTEDEIVLEILVENREPQLKRFIVTR